MDPDIGTRGKVPAHAEGPKSPISPNSGKTVGPENVKGRIGSPFGVRVPRMGDAVMFESGFVFQNLAGSSVNTVHLGHAQIRQQDEAVLYWECIDVPGELEVIANDCVRQLHDDYVGSRVRV